MRRVSSDDALSVYDWWSLCEGERWGFGSGIGVLSFCSCAGW